MEFEHDSDDNTSSIDIDLLTTETISVMKNGLENQTSCEFKTGDNQSTHFVNFVIDKKPLELKSGKSENVESDNGDDRGALVDDKVTDVNTKKKKKKRKKKNKKTRGHSNLDLSSSLQDSVCTDLYIKTDVLVKKKIPRTQIPDFSSIVQDKDMLLKKSVIPAGVEKQHSLPPYEVSLHQTHKQRKLERSQTKGPLWNNMKAPELTQEKKNDLEVLQMRHVLDPKHFYKKMDIRGIPKFFQTGKIIEDATDFYSGRIPKKQRKKTLVDELLADVEFKKYNKRKYAEIIEKTQKGKGAYKHMKRLKKKKK